MPQPTPAIIVEPFANSAPTCTPAAPVAGGRTSPFPAPSQTAITPGAASLTDGFPAQCMTAPTSGGTPPFGVDMNGIMNLVTQHICALEAGQPYTWSSALSTAMGGYAVGAVVQQAADPNAFWINTVADNTANPDSGTPGANGWWSTKPLNTTSAPTAGTHNDVPLIGASDEIHDISAAAGAIVITGYIPQRDGQKITLRKSDASGNAVTFSSLTGSAAGHQLQIVGAGLSLPLQYMSITLQFNATVNAWVQV